MSGRLPTSERMMSTTDLTEWPDEAALDGGRHGRR
jgi:hypothetical protein